MTTQSLLGKTIKLGRTVYKIIHECTPETHPNIFAHSKGKYHVGVEGPRGGLGSVTIWESNERGQRATAVWLFRGSRRQDFVGDAGAFEPKG